MRKKLAVAVCATLIAAMLGACGSSASNSQTEGAAQTETEESEAAEADAAAGEEAKAEEAAPQAEAAAGEEAKAEEAAPEADAAAGTETAAEGTSEAVPAAEISGGTLGAENALINSIQPAEGEGDSQIESVGDLGGQALGSAPDIEILDPVTGEQESLLSGRATLYGDEQEYRVFLTYADDGCLDYIIVFCNPTTRVLTCYAEVCDFFKSAGYTRQQMENFDIDQVYPGFTSMSCGSYAIYDVGSAYRLIMSLDELDNPDNLKETVDTGFFIIPGYRYGCLLDADSVSDSLLDNGAYEMNESEVEQAQIFK